MDSIHIFLIKKKMCILHIFITRIWLCSGLSSTSGCYVLYHFIHDIEAAAYEVVSFPIWEFFSHRICTENIQPYGFLSLQSGIF